MAPTSEERREVAENLREQLRYMRKNNSYDEDVNLVDCGNSAYRNIAGSVEPYGNFEKGNYVHIVERLADMIDPTCILQDATWDDGTCKWGCICSACGAHLEYEYAQDLAYCPECGARNEGARQ